MAKEAKNREKMPRAYSVGTLYKHMRWELMLYDLVAYLLCCVFSFWIYPFTDARLSTGDIFAHIGVGAVCVFVVRLSVGVYRQIWRYANPRTYLMLIFSDALACLAFFIARSFLFDLGVTFVRMIALFELNLLCCMVMRIMYQFLHQTQHQGLLPRFLRKVFARVLKSKDEDTVQKDNRIRIAIVGAGRVGVMLAEELANNPRSQYKPVCFIDIREDKAGRSVFGLPIFLEKNIEKSTLTLLDVQEIVLSVSELEHDRKRELYEFYQRLGFKVKTYDYLAFQNERSSAKRVLREFDVEELLFRREKEFTDDATRRYYAGKTVLITGGGGSIGSELARQIAKMNPKRLVILDVYENCAYDLQQELRIQYGDRLDLAVEIVTITDLSQLEVVFEKYRPNVVLHAAAHKHVPLMEHNCVEAVKNNVFGTLNVVNLCEKYGVEKAVMVSTDKAVNPTNVMGATKRMCEMIFLSRSDSQTSFSCTRFGNVLGSNGSVIPLFKRQIANGGPLTITDKRIIRYFMTIPEAAQLVLNSGAMAKHGDLFVLDMGKPVKILELAESMIRLSGFEPYKDIGIIETGLRPGEKLYEELLIKNEKLDKTENSMIFIERDHPLSREAIDEKLSVLREATESRNDDQTRDALKKVVPTFHSPAKVNQSAVDAEEMKSVETVA